MTKKNPIIWALVDERAGNTSQVLGVAEALGVEFSIKNIRYNKLARLGKLLKLKSLFSLTAESKKEICQPWPDVVISVARRMEPAALYIKKKNPAAKLIHIQKPGFKLSEFDLVTTPEHDFLKGEKSVPGNVLLTLGAPNRINEKALASGAEKWEKEFAHFAHPRIAVLVGGSTNKGEFTVNHALEFANQANDIVKQSGGSLLVTTSRRTPPEVIEFLEKGLINPKFFYDARGGGENPYFGLLACSDAIIASGDSVSMCSESCSTGKPVYIYAPEGLVPPKYQYFQKKLVEGGYAKMLGDVWDGKNYAPLNDSKIVAEYIKKNYCV